MATIKQNKLKKLLSRVTPGTPITSADLETLGISADLTVHYAKTGWLRRIARGVYVLPNDEPGLDQSLLLLQRTIRGFHVGGKTSLDWHGIRQYVAPRPVLLLYGWDAARLPTWFTTRFPSEYHRKRLFHENPERMLHVVPFRERGSPLASVQERALLEALSEVGVRQTIQEMRELIESTYNFRASVLQGLLKKCRSIKTIRLCLQLGQEAALPWARKLKPSGLPTGSDRPWVARSPEGLLVLKP